jgi:SAM-dependent methyltransferase
MTKYIYSTDKKILINSKGKSLNYSDGNEEERRMLELVQSDIDLSTFSEDLPKNMNTWPLEYHFSKKRHLAIRQFNIKKGDSVLELGSGCGSITRYLAEIGANVVSVEGTEARASVNRARCKDFQNVEIYVDNINEFEIDKKFDWILMIGVLEYSPKYSNFDDPIQEYLNTVQRLLKKEGKFILAIENKLGIKYFNGATEDHNGKPFYGPEDLYDKNDVTTWGKKELNSSLLKSGFKSVEFYSAFPDYKLPTLLIHESADNINSFRTEELLHYLKSHDYGGNDRRFFEESFFSSSLRKNGLLSHFANSFIVVCSNLDKVEDNNQLATYYSIVRKKQFCTKTAFNLEDGSLVVRKELLFEAEKKSEFICELYDNNKINFKQHIVAKSNYLNGTLLGFKFSKAVKRADTKSLHYCLDTWVKHLTENFHFFKINSKESINILETEPSAIKDILIEGNAVDCGMHNIVIVENNNTKNFDLEWQATEPVPLIWILWRNITVSLRNNYKIMPNLDKESLLQYIANKFNLKVSSSDFNDLVLMERKFAMNILQGERIDSLPLKAMFKL